MTRELAKGLRAVFISTTRTNADLPNAQQALHCSKEETEEGDSRGGRES